MKSGAAPWLLAVLCLVTACNALVVPLNVLILTIPGGPKVAGTRFASRSCLVVELPYCAGTVARLETASPRDCVPSHIRRRAPFSHQTLPPCPNTPQPSAGFTGTDFIQSILQGYGVPFKLQPVELNPAVRLDYQQLLYAPDGSPLYGGIVM